MTTISRKAYIKPSLLLLGSVKAMTAAGSRGQSENTIARCLSNSRAKPCTASEPALKENIVQIGQHPLGIGLYMFDYKPEYQDAWGHGRQFGVMADEVQAVMPEAIVWHDDGYRMVDYAMLGLSR